MVSTAPCPPDLIAALRERGLSGMTEVYGAPETAGVAVRRWPEAAYALVPHWRFAEATRDDAPEIVHPDHVAERLRGEPGVRDAAVRLMRPEEGQRLKAFVVPEAEVDGAALRDAPARWIPAALPAAERPTVLTVGPRRPTSLPGEPSDW